MNAISTLEILLGIQNPKAKFKELYDEGVEIQKELKEGLESAGVDPEKIKNIFKLAFSEFIASIQEAKPELVPKAQRLEEIVDAQAVIQNEMDDFCEQMSD